MSSLKISQLAAGNPAQAGDLIPIDRAGANFSLTADAVATFNKFQGLYSEPGMSMVAVTPFSSVTPGNVDVYTVPAGMRAFLLSNHFNSAATAISITPTIKISGTYYPTQAPFALTAYLSSQISNGFIAEAGQTFAINIGAPTAFVLSQVAVSGGTTTYTGTITGGGASFVGQTFAITGFTNSVNNITITVTSASPTTLVCTTTAQTNETHAATATSANPVNFKGMAFLFPNTNALKTTFLNSFSVGNNTLYTVPIGKTFYVAGWTAIHQNNTTTSTASYTNNSGSARTVSINLVPSAGSPSTANLIAQSVPGTGVANTAGLAGTISTVMSAGDFINVNTDANTATQFMYVSGYEQ